MKRTHYVTCAQHGRTLPYIVCDHVLAGAPVMHRKEATADNEGEIICELSNDDHVTPRLQLKLICARCARRFPLQSEVS